ncbi:MAG TPA: inner membrane CreD family protein, partial [Parvularculaceae bacterium]|nr:inner membrane CreD family protein [Parvularculaceae bacterium]
MTRFAAPARSLGLKLILIGALAFVLWIPCILIYALVWERSTRADGVRAEIHDLAGGAQTVSGPIILVPALVDTGAKTSAGAPVTRRITVAFTPQSLKIDGSAKASIRTRS